MATLSDYTAGTVSVSAGGTAVTGVGTGWLSAGFREGDEFFAAGWHGIVQSVNSNTSLTLYPIGIRGTVLSGAAYRLRYQGDGSRVTAQARQLVELLGAGNLEAIGGLVGAADKLIRFTGPGTVTLSDFKAKGQDLASAATTTELLTKLGPVLGGEPPTPSAAGVGLSDGDLNAITVSGVYNIAGTWSNSPFSTGGTAVSAAGSLIVITRGAVVYQWLQRAGQPQQWKRYSLNSGSSWTDWLVVDLPVVGTVSNSLGYANGAIIERGSNANGEYTRFADGTQMCMVSGLAGGPTTAYANVFRSEVITWTYPIAFSSTGTYGGAASAGNTNFWAAGNFAATTNCALRLWSVAASGTGTTVNAVAIGRWF